MSTVTEKEIVLDDYTTRLSEQVQKLAGHGELSKDGKHIDFAVAKFEDTLPEETVLDSKKSLTRAELLNAANVLQNHKIHLYAATADATSTLSLEAVKKHKHLETANLTVGLEGKDNVQVGWTRSEQRNAGVPKAGEKAEKKTVYGAMDFELNVTGTDPKVGVLHKVKLRALNAAKAQLGE